MKIIFYSIMALLLCVGSIHAQPKQNIRSLKTDDLRPMDVSEFLVWRWGFEIDEPGLHRLDLRFFIGTNELIHTWQFVENTNRLQRFEIAVDFLKDTAANQWRLYSAFRCQSSCWKQTVAVPDAVKDMKRSMGGGPILMSDGKYQLVKFYSKGQDNYTEIPLCVSLELSQKNEDKPNTTSDGIRQPADGSPKPSM